MRSSAVKRSSVLSTETEAGLPCAWTVRQRFGPDSHSHSSYRIHIHSPSYCHIHCHYSCENARLDAASRGAPSPSAPHEPSRAPPRVASAPSSAFLSPSCPSFGSERSSAENVHMCVRARAGDPPCQCKGVECRHSNSLAVRCEGKKYYNETRKKYNSTRESVCVCRESHRTSSLTTVGSSLTRRKCTQDSRRAEACST